MDNPYTPSVHASLACEYSRLSSFLTVGDASRIGRLRHKERNSKLIMPSNDCAINLIVIGLRSIYGISVGEAQTPLQRNVPSGDGCIRRQAQNPTGKFYCLIVLFFVFEKVNIILFRAKFISKEHARDRARKQHFRAMDARRITVKRQNQYASYQAPSFQYL